MDLNLIYAGDVPLVQNTMKQLTAPGAHHVVAINRNVRKDGKVIVCKWHNSVLLDDEGKMLSVMSKVADVTEQKRSEDALLESERRHKLLAETMLQGVVHQNAQGIIVFMNPAAERILGKTREQFLGSTSTREEHDTIREDGSLFPGEQHPSMVALRTGQAVRNTVMGVFNPQQQAYRWIQIDAIPLFRSGEGTPYEVYTVFSDITELKQSQEDLRASERLYRGIGESLDYGIWICDKDGRNIYASESLLKLLGITQEQCADFNWISALHPDDAADTVAAWKECVRLGSFWERLHRYRGVDGKWHPILARGVPIRNQNGEIVQWAGINLDVSQLKKTEQELQAALQSRDEFLSIASHELKTPITALSLQLQLIGRLIDREKPNTALAKMCAQARQSIQQLAKLLDELLDLTRIRAGRLNLDREYMDLRSAVVTSISSMADEAKQKGIPITLHGDAAVPGQWDPARVTQIIINLLSNAIKYGEGKPIDITVEAEPEKNHARLLVRDQGMGIPSDMQARIFERFERAVSSTKISGLGLGLYIVRQLVEAHGGTIRLESEPGKGSLFIVELPLHHEQ